MVLSVDKRAAKSWAADAILRFCLGFVFNKNIITVILMVLFGNVQILRNGYLKNVVMEIDILH